MDLLTAMGKEKGRRVPPRRPSCGKPTMRAGPMLSYERILLAMESASLSIAKITAYAVIQIGAEAG